MKPSNSIKWGSSPPWSVSRAWAGALLHFFLLPASIPLPPVRRCFVVVSHALTLTHSLSPTLTVTLLQMMSKLAAQPKEEGKSSKRKKFSKPLAKPIPEFSLTGIASFLPMSSLPAFLRASKKCNSSGMFVLPRGSYTVTDWNFVPRPPEARRKLESTEHASSALEAPAVIQATPAPPLAAARSAEESDSDSGSNSDTDRDTDYDTDSDATAEYKDEEPAPSASYLSELSSRTLLAFADRITCAPMPSESFQQGFLIKNCPNIERLVVKVIGALVSFCFLPTNGSVKHVDVTGPHHELFSFQFTTGLQKFEGLESVTVHRFAVEPGRVRDMLSNKDKLSKVKVGNVTLVLRQIGRSVVDGREECKLTWRKEGEEGKEGKEVKEDSGVDGLFVDEDLD